MTAEKIEMPEAATRSLLAKSAFAGLDGISHLCAGGETPVLMSHSDAVAGFFVDKADGMIGRERMMQLHGQVKKRLGTLLDLPAGDIAFFLNSSDGVATALSALDLRSGDNIVVARGDFNSLALNASLAAQVSGAELRFAGDKMVFNEDEIAAEVDRNTAAILVSHVSHLTGRRCELSRLRGIADACGARLIVDVSHSLGAMPIAGDLCDVVISCAYKWQLGVHGCAVFAVNSARWPDLIARTVGWHAIEDTNDWRNADGFCARVDATRFEAGNPPFMALYVLDNGLATLMAHEAAAREMHILGLTAQIKSVLNDHGVPVLTPASPEERAGNVAFAAEDPMSIVEALRRRNVFVWGGENRVRISAHIYNDTDDVTAFAAALGEIDQGLLPHPKREPR
jgi:selenocysteine lyase/cysteine desulfurase|tara:strand:+ start:5366 stop:6556 length:1191 start_codon:yes stop_codon:yes gene_type:complete